MNALGSSECRTRTGSPRRDLPPEFGNWNTVFKRFRDWVKADVFKRIFNAVSDDPDMEHVRVDATIVRVHRIRPVSLVPTYSAVQFHGMRSSRRVILWSATRARTQRSQASGSTLFMRAVSMSV